jgi:hypothetical protein
VYPTFIDVSGQREPTVGSRDKTVRAAFGGDTTAFRRVNPLDVLKHRRFPQLFGVLVAGTGDGQYAPQQRAVRAACQQAGITVDWVELPGRTQLGGVGPRTRNWTRPDHRSPRIGAGVIVIERCDSVREMLRRHGDSALVYMATWRGNRHWFSPESGVVVAYQIVGSVALTMGVDK